MAECRVELREPREHDADEFLAAVRASRDFHAPWAFPPATPDAYRMWLDRQCADGFAGFFICRRSDGAIVGRANLGHIVYESLCSAYLGYEGVASMAGRGYMTEGLGLVLAHAFGPLELHRVEANIQPGNDRSLALVERLGFTREGFSRSYLRVGGHWRDHQRWALLAEDFRAV
jgi:[ribosomal protein S5]-alanine N-acetyltransferase